jgi:hypothetical protein
VREAAQDAQDLTGRQPGHERRPGRLGRGGLGQRRGQGVLAADVVADHRRAQGRGVDHEPVEPDHLGPVAEPGDRVAALQGRPQVSVQGGQRRDPGLPGPHDAGRLVLVVGEAVQHEVVLCREVREQRAPRHLGRLGDLGHRHVVVPALEEQGDRRLGDPAARARLLPLPQTRHGRNPTPG